MRINNKSFVVLNTGKKFGKNCRKNISLFHCVNAMKKDGGRCRVSANGFIAYFNMDDKQFSNLTVAQLIAVFNAESELDI